MVVMVLCVWGGGDPGPPGANLSTGAIECGEGEGIAVGRRKGRDEKAKYGPGGGAEVTIGQRGSQGRGALPLRPLPCRRAFGGPVRGDREERMCELFNGLP